MWILIKNQFDFKWHLNADSTTNSVDLHILYFVSKAFLIHNWDLYKWFFPSHKIRFWKKIYLKKHSEHPHFLLVGLNKILALVVSAKCKKNILNNRISQSGNSKVKRSPKTRGIVNSTNIWETMGTHNKTLPGSHLCSLVTPEE